MEWITNLLNNESKYFDDYRMALDAALTFIANWAKSFGANAYLWINTEGSKGQKLNRVINILLPDKAKAYQYKLTISRYPQGYVAWLCRINNTSYNPSKKIQLHISSKYFDTDIITV